MKCEACGGDGQIEVGAYRGDNSAETRECKLCGGVVTVLIAADNAVEGLRALGRAASQAGIVLKESTSGIRRTVAVLAVDDAVHVHEWKPPETFGPYVRFGCHGCGKGLVFSRHGSLADGEAPDSSIVRELSRKALVFAARSELGML